MKLDAYSRQTTWRNKRSFVHLACDESIDSGSESGGRTGDLQILSWEKQSAYSSSNTVIDRHIHTVKRNKTKQKNKQTNKKTTTTTTTKNRERERERERDRQIDRQTDRQTDRDRETDSSKTIILDCPKAQILSPLLFWVFINDLPTVFHLHQSKVIFVPLIVLLIQLTTKQTILFYVRIYKQESVNNISDWC